MIRLNNHFDLVSIFMMASACSQGRYVIATVCALLGISLLIYPGWFFEPSIGQAAGLSILTLSLLVTGTLPDHLTIFLFFLLAMLFGVSQPSTIFSGFQTTPFWLIFGGFVMGIALISTGLGRRVASLIARKLEGAYPRLVTGMVLVGLMFSFLMPSATGRLVLLVPIAIAVADHFGFEKGSNGRIGLVMSTILGTYLPAYTILPANVPNMILAGLSESQHQISPLFGQYLGLHFPVLGLLKCILLIGLLLKLFPDQPAIKPDSDLQQSGAMSKNERWLFILLMISLAFWMTDFLHHISPAWIALAGAVILMMPKIGLVSHQQLSQDINYLTLFTVAGILGLGAMISESGLGQLIAEYLLAVLPLDPEQPFFNYFSISLASTVTGLATTTAGVPAIMSPLAEQLASATDMSVEAVLMLQVVGFSVQFLPYQAAPLMVAMLMTGEKTSTLLKPLFYMGILSLLILLPLNYVWWQLLGWI